jgi:CubicO group peptidase (beta-lactamase class C family)
MAIAATDREQFMTIFASGTRKWRIGLAFVMCLASIPAVAERSASTSDCGTSSKLNDGWLVDTPANAGLDASRLCATADWLKTANADVHAVVVIRHGKLVFEQYFAGFDDPWGMPDGSFRFDATTKHDMRSVSKSVTSLLIGIAIDRKLIASVDEPAIKFFPEYSTIKSPGWDAIKVGDLLTMSSGIMWEENLPWNDPRNDEPHLGKDADPLAYVVAKPIVAAPGTVWNYNGGGTDLLGAIIARASGKPLNEFARDALFEPLGISDWEWKSYENGKLSAAAGLRLRPRDAAKIGQLLLNQGAWNGKQIVSAQWIAQSVVARQQAIGYFGGLFFYGYQWWLGRTLVGDQ